MQDLNLTEIQKIESALLSSFARFCDEHHLRYFLAYGTLLGAARHRGFIPWDDDTDVWMPREDYKRFLDLEMPIGTFVIKHIDPDSNWAFSKLCACGTFFDEVAMCERSPARYGVFVDIFPLDKVPENASRSRFKFNCIHKIYRMFNIAYTIDKSPASQKWRDIAKIFIAPLLRMIPRSFYLKAITKLCEKNEENTSWVASYFGYARLFRYKKQNFSQFCFLEFEGSSYKCPAGWREVLETIYGKNWMTPIKRTNSNHGKAYVKDGVTVEEVVNRLTQR